MKMVKSVEAAGILKIKVASWVIGTACTYICRQMDILDEENLSLRQKVNKLPSHSPAKR